MSGIENFDIRSSVTESIVDVFDTMVSMEVALSDSEPPNIGGTNRMLAAVNFAGSISGIFSIQVTSELGCQMTASMRDIEPEEVEDDGETKDLLAEISKIVGGNLKSALSDGGYPCVISTPSITYGADFTIKSLAMERFERLAFKYQEHFILAEVGLKTQQVTDESDDISVADTQDKRNKIDLERVNALDLNSRVSESVIDVFDTMLSTKLEVADAATVDNLEGVRNVGLVSFAGDVTGMVGVHVAEDFLREITAEMPDMEVEELEGDDKTRDTLCEIGNIIGGNLKSAFTDVGLACVLSTPSFTTGTDYKIEALNMEKYERFAFRSDQSVVLVEMGIKISELVIADSQNERDNQNSEDDVADQENTLQAQQAVNEEKQSDSSQPAKNPEDVDLNLLLDIPLEIKVELGRAKVPIHNLLNFGPGSAVKLLKLEGEPVDILANDTLIAKGEVVVQNQKYGIRVLEITSRLDRIRGFRT